IKGLGNGYSFSVLQYHNIGHLIPPTVQFWIFLGFFFGFAIKLPMFPFHTWLPDAHTEAPTAGSIILAAVLLKMGTYGFVRFALPILPDGTRQLLPFIVGLSSVFAAIGIVLGAAYLLWLYQRVFWGPLDNPANRDVPDLNGRELGLLVALVACMVWIGIYPKPIFDMLDKPVDYIVRKVDPAY